MQKTKNLAGWKDGRKDGWNGGRESRVKDCLQQSKMVRLKKKSDASCVKIKFKWGSILQRNLKIVYFNN